MSRRTVKWKQEIRKAGSRDKAQQLVSCASKRVNLDAKTGGLKAARFQHLVDKAWPPERSR
jgi:hypothetical protein